MCDALGAQLVPSDVRGSALSGPVYTCVFAPFVTLFTVRIVARYATRVCAGLPPFVPVAQCCSEM